MKIIDRMYEDRDVNLLKQKILEKAHFRNLTDLQDKSRQEKENGHTRSKSRDDKKNLQQHKRGNSTKNGHASHRSLMH